MKKSVHSGVLYLLPNSIGSNETYFATQRSREIAVSVKKFIVEDLKSARRLLRALGYTGQFDDIALEVLNHHTTPDQHKDLFAPLLAGDDMAVISEAGVPCVADPGNVIVALAHENEVKVVPLSGPSSIILALMASGFNGQLFTFNGYLPREKKDRIRKIRQLEQQAATGHTQIFMDAPYRNSQVLDDLLESANMNTKLCIAMNISCQDEFIRTQTITEWHMKKPDINKKNVMFLLGKS